MRFAVTRHIEVVSQFSVLQAVVSLATQSIIAQLPIDVA
jgi:hypothetical protein